MTSQNTKVFTAHIPLVLAEKIDEISARLERSRGWIVKQALAEWIAQLELRHRLTLEAIADIDEGRVVDHSEIESWATGLGQSP